MAPAPARGQAVPAPATAGRDWTFRPVFTLGVGYNTNIAYTPGGAARRLLRQPGRPRALSRAGWAGTRRSPPAIPRTPSGTRRRSAFDAFPSRQEASLAWTPCARALEPRPERPLQREPAARGRVPRGGRGLPAGQDAQRERGGRGRAPAGRADAVRDWATATAGRSTTPWTSATASPPRPRATPPRPAWGASSAGPRRSRPATPTSSTCARTSPTTSRTWWASGTRRAWAATSASTSSRARASAGAAGSDVRPDWSITLNRAGRSSQPQPRLQPDPQLRPHHGRLHRHGVGPPVLAATSAAGSRPP